MLKTNNILNAILIITIVIIGCNITIRPRGSSNDPERPFPGIQSDSSFVFDQAALRFKETYNIRLEDRKTKASSIYRDELDRIFRKYKVKSYDRPLKSKSLRTVYRIIMQDKNFGNTYLFVEELKKLPYVEYAELVPAVRADIVPNDPLNTDPDFYHLSRIDAYGAFDIHQGGSKIAIIDTGFDTDHEDLINTIWTNPGEIPNNGLDDDGNGYVDDLHGWDTGDNDNDPGLIPQTSGLHYWHGTHVAGIAGADTDNGIGTTSIGFDNTIIPIKVTKDIDGDLDNWAAINAITYAIEVGAEVINMSISWPEPSSPLEAECINAHSSGIVLVASVGNLNDPRRQKAYPAFYPQVISVAATYKNDEIMRNSQGQLFMSNYGDDIDISAPGRFIFSTMPNDNYARKSGSSMAAPIIAGLAGLIKSKYPSITPDQVKHCMQQTAVDIDGINPGYAGWLGAGRVDAEQAIQCNGICAPANVLTLSPISTTPNLSEFPVGNNIAISSTVTGSPTTFEWVIFKSGDIVQTASTISPSLNFTPTAIGNYKIKMTAIGATPACNQTIFHHVNVVCGINASFTVNSSIEPGDPLNVVNTSSNPSFVNYTWYLDGVPYSFLPPTTSYDVGTHVLKLVATNYNYGCSIEDELYFKVFKCPIDQPIISDVTACLNQNVILTPTNSSSLTVNWYDQIADITPLHTGASYAVGAFSNVGTQDYFAEYVSEAPVYLVGESSSPGGQSAWDSNYSQLYFNSSVDFYFESFKIHVSAAGSISFTLKNSAGTTVWQITNQPVARGIQLIDVNDTFCPAGTYTLTKEYSSGAPFMWEYSNSNFPYEILNGAFSITGSYNNKYPAYYDIAISTEADCISTREAVIVNVVANGNDTDGDGICDSGDQCPGIDDSLIGTPCDDGNACTNNDIYDSNCNCVGTPITTYDLTVKDNPTTDSGIEPNPDDIWYGYIWNCATNPACTLATKENPEYMVVGSNKMKVRIHNIGCADHIQGQARLHLYWTIGRVGELWPTHWLDPMFQPSNLLDGAAAGNEITPSGGIDIPFISAGGTLEMEQDWIAPNPAHFPSLSDPIAICYLARIESVEDPINGEVNGDISVNVRNSNNIATINETLVDIDPGNNLFPTYTFLLNNPSSEFVSLNFSIEDIDRRSPSFFKQGRIHATLQEVGRKKGGDKKPAEIKFGDLQRGRQSQKITLKPGEVVQANMKFIHAGKKSGKKEDYRYQLKIKSKYSNRKMSGTEFIVNVRVKPPK